MATRNHIFELDAFSDKSSAAGTFVSMELVVWTALWKYMGGRMPVLNPSKLTYRPIQNWILFWLIFRESCFQLTIIRHGDSFPCCFDWPLSSGFHSALFDYGTWRLPSSIPMLFEGRILSSILMSFKGRDPPAVLGILFLFLSASEMSSYLRKYARYVRHLCISYKKLAVDICRIPKG